jgi:hypothetical protein
MSQDSHRLGVVSSFTIMRTQRRPEARHTPIGAAGAYCLAWPSAVTGDRPLWIGLAGGGAMVIVALTWLKEWLAGQVPAAAQPGEQ